MTDEIEPQAASDDDASIPDAVVEEQSRLSIVWLIPIIAALAGAWLAYTSYSDRGPAVTIEFATAEGLEAGKTKVKYKDVEVGEVEEILLSRDLSHVIVHARLVKGAERYMTENTRFWVVRAQVSAGRVSGLGTLFSGAYIGIDPSTEGKRQRKFMGLRRAPVVTSDVPGTIFTLRASSLGSIEVGAPVYYRWFEVGQVLSAELDESGKHVTLQVFVEGPHDKRVRQNSVFWNASGVDVVLSAEGLEVDTVSLTSALIGGVAFDSPINLDPGGEVQSGTVFELYPNRRATTRPKVTVSRRFLLYFDQSVGGLVPGAPVEFRGIRIGDVLDVRLIAHPETGEIRIPVLIEVQPERIAISGQSVANDASALQATWDRLVARGMRAQLKSGNLLTGQLAVGFDLFPDAPVASIDWEGDVAELPTIPSPIEELKAGLAQFMRKLDRLPVEEIGTGLNDTLAQLRALSHSLNTEVAPSLTTAVTALDQTLVSANALISPNSEAGAELRRLIRDLADAARSVRLLADHLEQHPEDLLRGKETD